MLDDPLLQTPVLNDLLQSPEQRKSPKYNLLHLAKVLDDPPLRAVEQKKPPEHGVLHHPRLLDHPKYRPLCQDLENRDCASVRHSLQVLEHQESPKHDALHRTKVLTYQVLLFLVGDMPWVLLLVCSLPWVLCPILRRRWQRQTIERMAINLPYLAIGPNTGQAKPLLRRVSSSLELEKFNVLLWAAVGTLMNAAIASVCAKLYTVHVDFGELPIFIYSVTFAIAALFRAILRACYGHNSEESAAVDKSLLEAFGVFLTQRGSSSRWIYPLISIGPSTICWAVFCWFSRAEFDLSCRPAVNGTFVMDTQHCTLHSDSLNYFEMMPFIVSHLMLVYGMTKGFAKFMVLMDQDAQGLPSELRAWSVKSWIDQPPVVFKF